MNQWYRHLIFGEGDKCYEWCWLLIIFYNLDKKHGRLQFPLDINYVVYYRQHPKKVIQHSWMVLPFHAHCAQMQRGNQAHRSRIRLFRSESPKSELLHNVKSFLCNDRKYFEVVKTCTFLGLGCFFSQKWLSNILQIEKSSIFCSIYYWS